MAAPEFKHLFTPLQLRHATVKNRIVTSAHADALAEDGIPKEKGATLLRGKGKGWGRDY